MVCMMAAAPSPTVLRRQLGAELRRMREDAHRTVADVAGELGWSESKLSRIETAHTGIRNADLERLLAAYGADEAARSKLSAMAGRSRQKAWWEAYGDALMDAYETYIGFEAEAVSISTYESQVVPGLLQTAEYASAIMQASFMDDPQDIFDRRVQVRMARQAVLTRDPPPRLRAILDEAVLRREVGGPDVLRRQMLRLIEVSEQPTITIQVLPFSVGAHPALDGSFILLEFAGGSDQPLVYSEGKTGGVFRSKSDDIGLYRRSFQALCASALSPEKSSDLISALAHIQS
jgi:transcriptional regulator with XRE-family HTH domain